MANDWFSFKRFTIQQAGAAMKVGTDGTLLGAWARITPGQTRILDVGTGTGLIALMLAQRSESWNAIIDAVEIDPAAAAQAADNFAASEWGDRLRVVKSGFGEFATERLRGEGIQSGLYGYDHIVSNPPFFTGSLESPDAGRTAARHTSSLTHEALIHYSRELLVPGGLLSVILPCGPGEEFIRKAGYCGLMPTRRTDIRPLPGAPPKRVMIEFQKTAPGMPFPPVTEGELLIESAAGGHYTEEYRDLTRDFYIKF